MASQYEVVHDKVVIRQQASIKAQMLSVAMKGDSLFGVATVIGGQPWLRIDSRSKEVHRLKQDEDAWVLIHGASVGLGELIRRVQEKPAPPSTQQTSPPVRNKDKEELVVAKEEENASEEIEERRQARSSEFIVVHTKVVVRKHASTTAAMVNVLHQGMLVEGVIVEIDGTPWLKLPTGYILIDGKSVGLGTLLEPAADIAEDIVRWAEQQTNSSKGKQVVQIAEIEDELRLHEREVHAQVDAVKAGFDDVVVLKVLKERGIIKEEDFSLGADELAKMLRRYVLQARAGLLIFGQEGPTTSSLWKESQFAAFLNESIVPLLPFHCRTFAADGAQRVLVAFHGSYVRGDDLADDAHVFRTMTPETTVVLPEAPFIVDKENELRVWWHFDEKEQKADGSEIENAPEKKIIAAPKDIISRAVSTFRWVRSRFGTSMPIILAGFSQGALLAVQMLHCLGESAMLPVGLALLSGLLQPFSIPPSLQNCVAMSGDQDDKIPIEVSRKAAKDMQNSPLVFIEFPGLGHEVSQKVLEKLLDFCNTAAPLENRLINVDMQSRLSEIRQAKVVNWVKSFASKAKTFNNEFFQGHIMVKDMIGLTPECPTLGGSNLRYFLHDAGPESRGLVLLFHGKIANLRKDTDELAQAYMKAFRLSVAIIDYRQQFSSFLVDAQIALESVEELSRSTSKPIIIHSIGIGSMHGLHAAMASMAFPDVVQRRFRLLVLDAAVSVFKALPPSPTGCIATDPIGNNQKLQYVGMPICMLSGEDACSGYQVQPKHWLHMTAAIEDLCNEGALRRSDITLSEDVALVDRGKNARLNADLYYAVSRALESAHRAPSTQKTDMLMAAVGGASDDITLEVDDAITICKTMEDKLSQAKNLEKLWLIRSIDVAQRDQRLAEFLMEVCDPLLRGHDGFSEEGFRKFDRIVAQMVDQSRELAKAHNRLRKLVDFIELDKLVEEKQRKQSGNIIALAKLHWTLDKSHKEWTSFQLREECLAKMKANPALKVPDFIHEKGKQLTEQAVCDLGLKSEAEMNVSFASWTPVDPSLGLKIRMIEAAAFALSSSISSELGSAQLKPKAVATLEAKEALVDQQTQLAPAPPYEPKGDSEMNVVVYIDRELDLKYEMRMKKGLTIATLKMRLAEADPTGQSDALDLCLKAEGQPLPVSDGALITEHLGALDICDPPAKALPSCTRTVALQCQKDIIEACATNDFQRKLAEALKAASGDLASPEFQVARAELMLEVQKPPAKKHGFGDKPIAVQKMMTAIGQFTCDLEVHENASIIQKLIKS